MKQHQTQCTKTKKVIKRGKRSKTLNEVKPVKNINKNPQSLLVQCKWKGNPFFHKLQDHAESFQVKERQLITEKLNPVIKVCLSQSKRV